MKKLSFILMIAVLSVISVSCEKETTEEIQNPEVTVKDGPILASMRTFFDNGQYPGVNGQDYGCSSPATNCYDDKVIFSDEVREVLQRFIDNQNNALSKWEKIQTDIEICKKHYELLTSEVFTQAAVGGVITGHLRMWIRGSEQTLSIDEMNYFTFRLSSDFPTVYRVFPVLSVGYVLYD